MVSAYNAAGIGGGSERNGMLFVIDTEDRLNREALEAKRDERKLEAFIRANKRFILGCAFKTTRRFVTESDDEWSIALIAFHEAVQSYDAGKGSFKQFAGLVIKRRLLDELGRGARHKNEIAADMSGGGMDDETVEPIRLEVERRISEEAIRRDEEATSVRDEIEAVGETLGRYGISFFDLTECSPKAQKTKTACAAVIRALIGSDAMMDGLRSSGTLPIKKLCAETGVPRKILENHRKYIIAAAEILYGDYPKLAEYLRFVKKGGETG